MKLYREGVMLSSAIAHSGLAIRPIRRLAGRKAKKTDKLICFIVRVRFA
jgi:hypothetical protein